jgi:hypothetical protein
MQFVYGMVIKGKNMIHIHYILRQISIISLAVWCLIFTQAYAGSTQERIDRDIAQGKPIVIHVSVALADNKHQWIASVPEAIGNGQDPRNNLYWGARYGLKTFFVKDAGWKIVKKIPIQNRKILERLVFYKLIKRHGRPVKTYLIADAWDGRYISETIQQFLSYSAGADVISIDVRGQLNLQAGGAAHLNAYVGHDALMDYFGLKDKAIQNPEKTPDALQGDSIVLACKSKPYFEPRLKAIGSHPLVLTTGLMAPEAYTLDAAIMQWVMGKEDNQIRKSAAAAYAKYQKINLTAAKRLFAVVP